MCVFFTIGEYCFIQHNILYNVHNDKNLKLIATLNKGLELAKGEYIARMDCDDISLPERLAKQVAFMDSNPSVGLCGTWLKTFGNVPGRVWRHPENPDEIRCRLLFESVVSHATVMMRRQMMEKHGLRYGNYLHAEDFQLWQRAIEFFPIVNIGEMLYLYRITGQNVTRLHNDVRKETLRCIDREAITTLGLSPSPSELVLHRCLGSYEFGRNREFVEEAEIWLLKLHDTNNKTKYYPNSPFDRVLARKWHETCVGTASLGFWSWRKFWQSPLSGFIQLDLIEKIKFMVKCGIRHKAAKL